MRRVILAICATAVGLVLLLSFKTHTQTAAPGASPAAALGSPAPGASGGRRQRRAPRRRRSTAAGTQAGTAPAKTVTGAAWPTIYGPVQVQVTVTAGKVTAVAAVEYPTGTPRD